MEKKFIDFVATLDNKTLSDITGEAMDSLNDVNKDENFLKYVFKTQVNASTIPTNVQVTLKLLRLYHEWLHS